MNDEEQNAIKAVIRQASKECVAASSRPHSSGNDDHRVEDSLALAIGVQRAFLPRIPNVAGYEFFSHYQPAREIGGDHLDVIELADGRVAVIILDVAGKDVPASLMKARVSGALNAHFHYDGDPASVVGKLNAFVCQTRGNQFVTFAVAILDPASHTVAVVNAGHLPPLLFRPHRGTVNAIPDETAGLPLGVVKGEKYESYQLCLQPGECLLMFTDGVPDAQGVKGECLGMDRIANSVHEDYLYSPSGLGHTLLSAVQEHAAGRSQFDDIALVCFGRVMEMPSFQRWHPASQKSYEAKKLCPQCGEPLRSNQAKQCFECGADWH